MESNSWELSEDTKRAIGVRFQKVRESLGLTQSELGEALNRLGQQISRLETGQNLVTVKILVRMYELYKIDVGYILTGRRVVSTEKVVQAVVELCEKLEKEEL